MKIEPHLGTDTLRFGLTQDEVREVLGEPEDVEVAVLDGDAETTAWHYWEQGISLFFDTDTDDRLCTIEVDSPLATLGGKAVVGVAAADVDELLAAASAPDNVLHDAGFVEVPEWDLNLWIEGDVVESVQWEVKRDADDAPEWPARGA